MTFEIDPNLLPNITLGWDIRDTCWYPPIALENSIDFIKDAIASQQAHANAASSSSTEVTMSPTTQFSNTSSSSSSSSPCVSSTNLTPIIGLVGPGLSETSIQVQNLLQIFNIPQIGYSATSSALSAKSLYKYYLRVVPSDLYQAKALVDILMNFNWTYVSLVHSDGNYGTRGMMDFKAEATSKGICFGAEENIATSAEDEKFDAVVEKLLHTPMPTVVVCFCEGMTLKKLGQATRRKNVEGAFLLLGSDGWGNRQDVAQDVESALAGGMSLKLYSPPVADFKRHYASLEPYNSSHNPWFKEFWEQKFSCSLDENSSHMRACTVLEKLKDRDASVSFMKRESRRRRRRKQTEEEEEDDDDDDNDDDDEDDDDDEYDDNVNDDE
ncbi:metabotropic glutamate receptor [Plakobranchus ocellatus]|uniref:Metabotropic glutamate receptor n=1 Tax=Plakobranchus ocellatus TaxID=259542 RepID=A0AAV3ZGR4_9GAST|nr:metabotropic glutamate receptor [Plakobranchus ocellatus]